MVARKNGRSGGSETAGDVRACWSARVGARRSTHGEEQRAQDPNQLVQRLERGQLLVCLRRQRGLGRAYEHREGLCERARLARD